MLQGKAAHPPHSIPFPTYSLGLHPSTLINPLFPHKHIHTPSPLFPHTHIPSPLFPHTHTPSPLFPHTHTPSPLFPHTHTITSLPSHTHTHTITSLPSHTHTITSLPSHTHTIPLTPQAHTHIPPHCKLRRADGNAGGSALLKVRGVDVGIRLAHTARVRIVE